MVTFAQLRDARPAVRAAAAETWELRAAATGRRAKEVQSEVLDTLRHWSGPAAQAALPVLIRIVADLTEAQVAMRQVADNYHDAHIAIGRAQGDLQDGVDYARGKGLTVEDDGSVSWLDWNPLDWGADRSDAQRAAGLIGDALRLATEADVAAEAGLRVARLVARDEAPLAALTMSDDPQVERAVDRFGELLDEAGRSS